MICLQTPTVFWIGGGTISLKCAMYMGLVMLGRHKYTQQNQQCLSQVFLSLSWLLKSKSHESPGIEHIPAELIEAGDRTLRYGIHKLIISIWNKEELHEAWKELIIVPNYKKGDKTGCSNYRDISLLPTTYKIEMGIQ